MATISTRITGLLIRRHRALGLLLVNVTLAVFMVATFSSAAYLTYIFLNLVGQTSNVPVSQYTSLAYRINIVSLVGLVVTSLPRIWLLLVNPGRLIRKLILAMLLPLLLATTIFGLALTLFQANSVRSQASKIPISFKSSNRLLRELMHELRGESFAFVTQLAPQLTTDLSRQAPISAGYHLEEAVSSFGLRQAAILDNRGRFYIVAPDSERVGSTPNYNIPYHELTKLIARARQPQDTIGSTIDYYRSIDEPRDGTRPAVRIHRAILPLGTFNIGNQDKELLLLLDAELPRGLYKILDDITETDRQLNMLRSQSEGSNRFLLLLSFNALFLALSLGATAGTLTIGSISRRLSKLSLSMDEVAKKGGIGSIVQASATEKDEFASLANSFNTMSQRISSLIGELAGKSEFLNAILNNLDAGIVVLDVQNQVIRVNEACRRLLGNSPIVGETLAKFASRNKSCAAFSASAITLLDQEHNETQAGSRMLLVRASVLPELAGGGRIVVFSDISEPLAGQQLRAWNEALQRFLHEVKNPLQPLLLSAETLNRKIVPKINDPADAKFMQNKVETMIEGINRIDRVIRSLRSFTSQRPLEYVPVDLNAAAQKAALRHNSDKVTISLSLADGLPLVLFEPDFLARIFDNLLINARETAEEKKLPQVSINIATYAHNNYAHASIQDNAGGIAPERIDLIFNPHISFKAEGSGLGLAHVKGMLTEGGGNIVAKNYKTGAQFIFSLPHCK